MGNKNWRITDDQEFYVKANKYLENHLEVFIENLENSIHSKTKIKEIWRMYDNYRRNMINSAYVDRLTIKINDMLNIVLEDVENWAKFSTNFDNSLDEIMLRILISRMFDCSYVSLLLISVNPNLTEEFVEDCIYVSSDLFRFSEWDDEHVDAVTTAASQCVPEDLSEVLLELYDKKRLSCQAIPIRLNLKEYCCTNKDPIFMTKYYSYLNPEELKQRRFRH